jgi:hypothetical protein
VSFSAPILAGLLATAAQAPIVDAPAEALTEALAEGEAVPLSADLPAEEPGEEEEEGDGEEIVVTGQRERGAVIGDIPPENQLDRREIRSYGASNLTELLQAISPQTRSGRGRGGEQPVVLLNGRRISSFREIRNFPPEAIIRVDILPEEVALRYGYRADQRVVNFVTRRRFRAVTAELEGGLATAGGRGTYEADLNILRIDQDRRWNIDFEYSHADPLFESERDIVAATSERPFDLTGNVGAFPFSAGAEIDPALSAVAGQPVTIAGVPTGATTLTGFAARANQPNVTDFGRYRTLLAETDAFSLNGTVNRTIFGDVAATLNASVEASETTSRQGLPSAAFVVPADNPFSPFGTDVTLFRAFDAPRPLTRLAESRTGHVGVALNGDAGRWRWSFTGNYDLTRSVNRSDRGVETDALQAAIDAGDPAANPFGDLSRSIVLRRDRARSTFQVANAELVANGNLAELPAGNVSATVRAGVETRGIDSRTLRSGIETNNEVGRDRGNLQASLDIPIARRSREVLPFLGDLSVNFNGEVEQLSDFGTLRTLGAGLNWEPIDQVRLIASVTDEDGAPTIQQLGDPVFATPNVRVFDFTRGETVEVERIDGGNPDIRADNRRVYKLGATLNPFKETDLQIRADYTKNRIRNPIASFPAATPEIEAAFPERFVRGPDGQLVRIDTRPVNFARSDREQLRWGFNYSRSIGPEPSPEERQAFRERMRERRAQGGGGGQGARRGGGGGRGGFGGGGFGGGGRGGRLQLSLYHTWHLKDEILIRQGVPVLDLLGGSATGERGGQPEHEIELSANLSRNGLGARLSTNWQSGTDVRGGLDRFGNATGDLRFSDFTTVNLRLFADLGQQRALVRSVPFLRGTRVSLAVNNLFDSGLRVRGELGATPVSYQPDLLDPLGRSVTISIRKLFF